MKKETKETKEVKKEKAKKTVSNVKEKVEKKEVIEKKNMDVKKTGKSNKKKVDETEKTKKVTVFRRIGNWFKEEFLELKRVSWPSKKVVWKNFVATLICVLFLGILFYLIDIIIVWLKTVVI